MASDPGRKGNLSGILRHGDVHLRLRHGKRFDSSTGKEISPEFNQVFSYSEWRLFKAHHIGLGYRIIKVLFDPYGEAKED